MSRTEHRIAGLGSRGGGGLQHGLNLAAQLAPAERVELGDHRVRRGGADQIDQKGAAGLAHRLVDRPPGLVDQDLERAVARDHRRQLDQPRRADFEARHRRPARDQRDRRAPPVQRPDKRGGTLEVADPQQNAGRRTGRAAPPS